MFGLIGHSTSFEDAKRKASILGFDHIADGDLDVWCTAPPQLVENVEVKSAVGISIEGSYIDSCFVPEMLSRFKTARRKVLNAMELAQKKGINITALGGFTSIIFENFNLLQHKQIRNTSLEWERFTTGNTHTAWVICRQLEINAPKVGIDIKNATVAVVGATGDIGSAVCRWLINKTGIKELLMVARQQEPLKSLQKELGGGTIKSLDNALPEADIVVWVASMPKTMDINTNILKKPCLMIDMELAEMKNPQREMFACFAEAMILEFEKCHTNFSWGRNNISLEKMEFIGAASVKHGFTAIGLDKKSKVIAV